MFPSNHKLKFSPDDKVIDIYRGLYPSRFIPDVLELETFQRSLQEEYGFDLRKDWNQDITLGEIFSKLSLIGDR